MKIYFESYGGPRGIRTPEGRTSGFTVHPIWPLWYRPMFCDNKMEPPIGFEPMTYGLQDRRSTSWAMVASFLLWDYREMKNISK